MDACEISIYHDREEHRVIGAVEHSQTNIVAVVGAVAAVLSEPRHQSCRDLPEPG